MDTHLLFSMKNFHDDQHIKSLGDSYTAPPRFMCIPELHTSCIITNSVVYHYMLTATHWYRVV